MAGSGRGQVCGDDQVVDVASARPGAAAPARGAAPPPGGAGGAPPPRAPRRGRPPPPPGAVHANPVDPRLQPAFRQLQQEGPDNVALNHMRIGVKAMELGLFADAGRSFDEVLGYITSVFADNDQAARARSLWYEEGTKVFRGEPYERAMAFYYRGVLDLMDGEYDTARASFRGGLLQDAFAEEEQHRADFALMMYLDGWSSFLMGERRLADEAFEEARFFRPDLPLPKEGDNVLIIAESGPSPRKLADGVGHAELVYRRGRRFTEQRAVLVTPPGPQHLYPIEDIYWQASTRGGRPVDAILAGQVRFRQRAETVGSVLSDGALAAAQYNTAWTGSSGSSGTANVVGAVGIVSLALAARARPGAAARHWDNLPDGVHVLTARVPRGTQPEWGIQYADAAGKQVDGLGRPVEVHWDRRGNGIVWVRSRHSIEP
jgi:tetratricopeptide (TPR) repeat protein